MMKTVHIITICTLALLAGCKNPEGNTTHNFTMHGGEHLGVEIYGDRPVAVFHLERGLALSVFYLNDHIDIGVSKNDLIVSEFMVEDDSLAPYYVLRIALDEKGYFLQKSDISGEIVAEEMLASREELAIFEKYPMLE